MNPTQRIVNAEALTRIFGEWPSFHDAEVLSIRLDRGGPPRLEADIHTWEMTSEVTADGSYARGKHTRVGLLFEGIDEVELDGFNEQNVLFALTLTDISERQLETATWQVAFESSFGVSVRFLCETIAVVRAEPFDPAVAERR
jgi:hypothetical protein